VIGLYLEGVKEGARFVDILRRADGRKPIVLFKAGRTRAGTRAVMSHTASMSGDAGLWEAVAKQFGVVKVQSMQEMADALLAFQFLPPSDGRNALVMGGGGGGSVAAADTCESEGFEVPPLPPDMREAIRGFAPDVWSLISNPMDGSVMGSAETLARAFQMGARWEGTDLLLGNSSAVWLLDHPKGLDRHALSVELLISLARENRKPAVIFVNAGDTAVPWRVEAVLKAQERCAEEGIPVYPNIQRAARALAHFTRYHRRRRRQEVE
jgi:acyl-CoA synthetase (NDP forming)